MCYWNVVFKFSAVCLEDCNVKVTFCLGDIIIFHDTWMYGLMGLRGWTVRKVSQSADLKDTFSVLSLTTWWHRSPAWNTQGKNARKYSSRRNLNKTFGVNFRVFAITVRFSPQENHLVMYGVFQCWFYNKDLLGTRSIQDHPVLLLC